MAVDELVVHGAREHNLKDITVRLPRNAVICITGLSGSGKSSLAFDTIYAEGQRRYVESLSAYARQFLQMMEKPDVDSIDGLSPAISIDQKTTSRNPRSTVGHGHRDLRLPAPALRAGRAAALPDLRPADLGPVGRLDRRADPRPARRDALHRQRAGRPRPQGRVPRAVREPAQRGLLAGEGRRRAAPARGAAGARQEVQAHDRGGRRPARAEGRPAHAAHPVGRDGAAARRRARHDRPGRARTAGESRTYSEKFACPEHGVSLPELQPRIFSFNSPHGACPRCTGLGAQQEIDPDLLVPDPGLSIDDGALVPWAVGGTGFYESVIQAIADRYEIPTDVPWEELTSAQQDYFLNGTRGDKVYVQYRNRMGRRRSYMLAFEGIVASLGRRYRETDSSSQRERIEEYMSFRPCPACKGARLKPEVLAVTIGDAEHPRVHAHVGHRGARVPRRARADRDRAADRRPHRQGDPRAADLPRRRRRRVPPARPFLGVAVGRRGAAPAARDADRQPARRRPLHPRRAVDRAAPARQQQADRHARAAAEPRQHRRRRRARRADDAQRRLARRHGAGRGRARRPRRRRGDGREGDPQQEVGDRPVPLRRALDRRAAAPRRGQRLVHACAAPRSTT